MNKLLILLFCIIAVSCASPDLIFKKDNGDFSTRGFYSEDLLYIRDCNQMNRGRIFVYDPRTSLIVTAGLEKNPYYHYYPTSCWLFDLRGAELHFIASPELRAILNNALENPKILGDSIDYVFSSLQKNVKIDWRAKNIESISDIFKYLKQISNESASSMIQAGLIEEDRKKAERETSRLQWEQKREQERLREKQAHERWDNRLALSLSLGNKVCTHDTNLFGYVESSNDNNKIKVHIVGQANDVPGYFFKGKEGGFKYSPIESIRWFTRDEIAPCYFESEVSDKKN